MTNKYGIWGEFYWEIVDEKTGRIDSSGKKKKNLILNQGLDALAVRSFVDNVAYCAVSANTTAPLYTDTGLISEFSRTNTLDTSIANSSITSLVGNVYSFTRVFKFSANLNPAYYGSVGWSYSATIGNNLFSKALIEDTNGNANLIFVQASKYLRIYYTINITLSPSTSTSGNSNIVGISNDGGTYSIQLIGLKSINSSNVVGYYDAANDANELYSTAEIFVGTNSTALSAFGSSTNRSGSTNYVQSSSNTYLGNGVLQKSANFGKGNAVNTLRSMGIGAVGSSSQNSSFAYVFTNNQSKLSAYLLSPTFQYSIIRM